MEIRNVENVIEKLELENTLLTSTWLSVDWNLCSLVVGPSVPKHCKKDAPALGSNDLTKKDNKLKVPVNSGSSASESLILSKTSGISSGSPLNTIISSFRLKHDSSKMVLPKIGITNELGIHETFNTLDIRQANNEVSATLLAPAHRLQPNELSIPQILAIENNKMNTGGLAIQGLEMKLEPMDFSASCGAQFYTKVCSREDC
jgi:hypothetical protein